MDELDSLKQRGKQLLGECHLEQALDLLLRAEKHIAGAQDPASRCNPNTAYLRSSNPGRCPPPSIGSSLRLTEPPNARGVHCLI